MTIDNSNWEKIAKNILEQEKIMKSFNYPEPISVLVTWDGDVYIGSIQEAAPRFSDEIVILSKSSYELDNDLVNMIRKLDKERLELIADNSLDLHGRQHVLRRLGGRLLRMNDEQTKYMVENMPHVIEINKIES
jgi:hypothetical protein